ncbi:MAG TPA: PEGA domain-containing protein [Candidatus Paceibacterota bacterium]
MIPLSLKKRRIALAVCALLFITIMPILILYTLGYRLGPGFHLVETGGLYISAPFSGAEIYINERNMKHTNILQYGFLFQNLKPGVYNILVNKEGYWPWSKILKVEENLVTEGTAFLIPQNPTIKIIPKDDEGYNKIIDSFFNVLRPGTTTIERFAYRGRERLSLNFKENKVRVEWLGDTQDLPYYFCGDKDCDEERIIIESPYSIRTMDFFPGRKDVIIVALQNAIYAVEIDKRGGQMLQPIYKGKKPVFIVRGNDPNIYILDDKNLIQMNVLK